MEYQRKKKLTNCTIGLLFLSGGIEYAVILPTIWAYLQTLHAEPYFLGLGISAFSLTGLLVGPLFGHWSDRSQRTKAVILFANMFEIAGNFMYFMGISKWLLLGSRLVAGVGTGVGASIFGYLTRSTTSQERATVFAAVMACRQVGLLIGPACNLFLRLCNFRLGPFEVNKFTAPGLFMCLLWVLLQFVVMAMYYDLQPGPHLQRAALAAPEEEEKPLVQHEAGQEERDGQHGYGSTGTAQRAPGEPPEGDEYRYVPNGHLAEEEGREKETSPFQNFSVMREYLREEVVVLLTAQFITLFNQTALETMVTPITQRYLSFGELENSIMYFLCGIEVICGFFLVRCLSSRLPDRVILVLGLVICNVACVWCLLFLARPRGAGAALRGRLPGLALLQGHSGKNTRVQPGPAAVCGGRRHHSGAPVGWRSDREPLRHAGGDDGPAEPADGYGRALVLLPGGAAQGLRAGTVPGGAALVTSRLSTARPTGLHGSKPPR
ncbi:major facilitator superfamily domain-containing protein 8-like isoform X1 [Pelodiscus sinensis]|uniref:major facilitator superfamily domain-containing protein 8-like isoform X1 n=1 Tax=Pelodiscus sinensis TaxID=13735 RepID=UPI003F6B21D9